MENTQEKSRKVGHLKMKVIENLKEETLTASVQANVSNQDTIASDHFSSYVKLKDAEKEHRPEVIPKKETGKAMALVYSNKQCKKTVIGLPSSNEA